MQPAPEVLPQATTDLAADPKPDAPPASTESKIKESPAAEKPKKANAKELLSSLYSLDSTIDPKMWREEFISFGGFD